MPIIPNTREVVRSLSSPSIQWKGDWEGCLSMLDQTLLPGETTYFDCMRVDQVWEAIRMLRVRGAPAIGIAAAYGVCLAIRPHMQDETGDRAKVALSEACRYLASSRPTAVNLFWALARMQKAIDLIPAGTAVRELGERLLAEATQIHEEDRIMCHRIGAFGADLLSDSTGVLTHCNAGGLATAEYGTALAAIFTAQDQGKMIHVFIDETRPLLQGARLTAWELTQRNVPCTLICDSMAAQVMQEQRVQAVIVGADRITARGDTANKIGTYSLAILAKYHKIPFYVAAPTTTFDLSIVSGADIPIEQRSADEITQGFGRRTAPHAIQVYNPAFDVTPSELISAIVTERGVIRPVSEQVIRQHVAS